MLFFFQGIELVVGAWLPTFVVTYHLTDAKEGTRFNSLYWLVTTVVRFGQGHIKATMSQKVKFCVGTGLAVALACALLSGSCYFLATAYCCSILFGLFLSPLYPLVLSIPSEYGLIYTP